MGDRCITKKIQTLSRQIKREMDEIFQSEGLTGVQAFVLHFIYETSEIKKVYAKDIENEFDMRRATVAELIQSMEQNNLVERKTEESDCRMKEIILTEKALKKIHYIGIEMKQLEDKLATNIPKQELDAFFKTLSKISNNL